MLRHQGLVGTRLCSQLQAKALGVLESEAVALERRFDPGRSKPASPELQRLGRDRIRSEEHTSELQSPDHLVCRLLLEKKKNIQLHLSLLAAPASMTADLQHRF